MIAAAMFVGPVGRLVLFSTPTLYCVGFSERHVLELRPITHRTASERIILPGHDTDADPSHFDDPGRCGIDPRRTRKLGKCHHTA